MIRIRIKPGRHCADPGLPVTAALFSTYSLCSLILLSLHPFLFGRPPGSSGKPFPLYSPRSSTRNSTRPSSRNRHRASPCPSARNSTRPRPRNSYRSSPCPSIRNSTRSRPRNSHRASPCPSTRNSIRPSSRNRYRSSPRSGACTGKTSPRQGTPLARRGLRGHRYVSTVAVRGNRRAGSPRPSRGHAGDSWPPLSLHLTPS
jgi:hypothetical protein